MVKIHELEDDMLEKQLEKYKKKIKESDNDKDLEIYNRLKKEMTKRKSNTDSIPDLALGKRVNNELKAKPKKARPAVKANSDSAKVSQSDMPKAQKQIPFFKIALFALAIYLGFNYMKGQKYKKPIMFHGTEYKLMQDMERSGIAVYVYIKAGKKIEQAENIITINVMDKEVSRVIKGQIIQPNLNKYKLKELDSEEFDPDKVKYFGATKVLTLDMYSYALKIKSSKKTILVIYMKPADDVEYNDARDGADEVIMALETAIERYKE